MQPAACGLHFSMLCLALVYKIILQRGQSDHMSKLKHKNYLDYIPVKNPDIEYETGENGIITLYVEWKGFYHRIAQKFFRRPRVSDIKMDDYGSFVWLAIDDKKDVHQLSKELDDKFPDMEKSLSRLIKFLEILHDNHLIYWKGEKKK